MKRKVHVKLLSLILLFVILLTGCGLGSSKVETPSVDRAGNPLEIPAKIEKIISLAPSVTQTIEALGLKEKLIAVDTQSPFYTENLDKLPQFNMMAPDLEALAALKPDIIFVTGMSSVGGEDPFKQLRDLEIPVATIPSSISIEGIKEDTQFIADSLSLSDAGKKLNDEMQAEIDKFAKIGQSITTKKKVLFEIAALPDIYSFGQKTFLHEMIELLGAENVLADQESWVALNEEEAIVKNPDVILTSVNYIEDPVKEILERNGWDKVTAIKDKAVFAIDNASSSLPNHNIIKALKEMALAIYPEEYKEMKE